MTEGSKVNDDWMSPLFEVEVAAELPVAVEFAAAAPAAAPAAPAAAPAA